MLRAELVLQNSYVEALTLSPSECQNVTVFRDRAIREVIKLNEVIRAMSQSIRTGL
jgi:hypothetical protein